jgi:hypothetical protein
VALLREQFSELTSDPAGATVHQEHGFIFSAFLGFIAAHKLLKVAVQFADHAGFATGGVGDERTGKVSPVPALVVVPSVPLNCFFEAVFPGNVLGPSEREQLTAIDEVPSVVELAVLDVLNRLGDVLT